METPDFICDATLARLSGESVAYCFQPLKKRRVSKKEIEAMQRWKRNHIFQPSKSLYNSDK